MEYLSNGKRLSDCKSTRMHCRTQSTSAKFEFPINSWIAVRFSDEAS